MNGEQSESSESEDMSNPFSFDDRVAGRYNRQRGHPPEVSAEIGKAIVGQVGVGASLLEIGVGTGRIAWPVLAAGGHVAGIDISTDMLNNMVSEYRRQPGVHAAFCQADMHWLPFRERVFDGVMAVHVLHLAKAWQTVLAEAARVLRPGGAMIQGQDWIAPDSVVGFLRDKLREWVIANAPNLQPPSARASRAQVLADLGGTETEQIVAAEWTTWASPNERLQEVANRHDAESWVLSDDLFDDALAYLRDLAAATWDDLDARQPVTRRFMLTVTKGDW